MFKRLKNSKKIQPKTISHHAHQDALDNTVLMPLPAQRRKKGLFFYQKG